MVPSRLGKQGRHRLPESGAQRAGGDTGRHPGLTRDPATGQLRPIDDLRQQYLQRQA